MAFKTVIKQLADKKLPKRTTDEALAFQRATNSDNTVNEYHPKEPGQRIEFEDIKSTSTEYGVIEDEPTMEPKQISEAKNMVQNAMNASKIEDTRRENGGNCDVP